MNNLIFSQIDVDDLIIKISSQVTAKVLESIQGQKAESKDFNTILDEYIPKTEVRGVLASNSTLWAWEKSGKLKLYAIGGKRFYKRADIENLFQEVEFNEKAV